MAILGLGTDIVEIARIEAVITRSGERLARRVLSDNEWEIWENAPPAGAFSGETLCRKRSRRQKRLAPGSAMVWRLISLKYLTMSLVSHGCDCGARH